MCGAHARSRWFPCLTLFAAVAFRGGKYFFCNARLRFNFFSFFVICSVERGNIVDKTEGEWYMYMFVEINFGDYDLLRR